MESSRRILVGLILGGVGLLFFFLGGGPVGLALNIVGLILTVQGLRSGESKLLAIASIGLNGLALVLNLIGSLLGGLWHLIF